MKLTVDELFHQADTVLYNLYFGLLKLNLQNSFTRMTRCIIIFLYQPGKTKCTKIVSKGCHHQIFNFLISPVKLTVQNSFTRLTRCMIYLYISLVKLTVDELFHQADTLYYSFLYKPGETYCKWIVIPGCAVLYTLYSALWNWMYKIRSVWWYDSILNLLC